ncbi:MAG: type II toxin-antitoxin system VapC family toxin [Pseudomonadota bacterium]
MSAVVDASVLVAALVDAGPKGAWAEEVLASGDLHAPALVQVETASTLRRLEMSGVIATPEANAAYEDLLRLNLELLPFDPFAQRIWDLRRTVSSYDAWYVAAAEALELPLATLDARLTRANGPRCRFLSR